MFGPERRATPDAFGSQNRLRRHVRSRPNLQALDSTPNCGAPSGCRVRICASKTLRPGDASAQMPTGLPRRAPRGQFSRLRRRPPACHRRGRSPPNRPTSDHADGATLGRWTPSAQRPRRPGRKEPGAGAAAAYSFQQRDSARGVDCRGWQRAPQTMFGPERRATPRCIWFPKSFETARPFEAEFAGPRQHPELWRPGGVPGPHLCQQDPPAGRRLRTNADRAPPESASRSILPATKEAAGVPSAWSQPSQSTHERPRRWCDAGPLGRQSVTVAQKAGDEETENRGSIRFRIRIRNRNRNRIRFRIRDRSRRHGRCHDMATSGC